MTNEFIPGRNAVEEALRAERKLTRIVVARDSEVARSSLIREARRRHIEIVFADRAALDSLVGKGNHQGIIAIGQPRPPAQLDDILNEASRRKEQPFIAILDGVEDPQNLGAIIRSAEVAGVHGIVIPDRRAARVTASVHKASAGAAEHMRVVQVPNLVFVLKQLRAQGIWIIGAENRASRSLWDEELRGPVAFVVGGEDIGLTPAAAERCDRLVKIPMKGRIRSLNVAATAAILFFEKRRQDIKDAGRKDGGGTVKDRSRGPSGPERLARQSSGP